MFVVGTLGRYVWQVAQDVNILTGKCNFYAETMQLFNLVTMEVFVCYEFLWRIIFDFRRR